jgi:hypothetical protein
LSAGVSDPARRRSTWPAAHTEYFTRECARIGREFTEDMPVACERFAVLYRPPEALRAPAR